MARCFSPLFFAALAAANFWWSIQSLSDFESMAAIQSSIVETVGSLVHEPRTTNNASATTPTAANNNNDSTHLFIHVGPVKTGSTSIQCNLQVNPFLKVDSYYFLGKMD